ncbi:MAG: hypothetical protein KAH32_04610, partial [Chlamydiia bacterium]|nr:hypothetical protein [Chlamydiia bacterium]
MSKLGGLTYKKKIQKFQNAPKIPEGQYDSSIGLENQNRDSDGYVIPMGSGENFPIMHGYEQIIPGAGAGASGLLNSGQALLGQGARTGLQLGTGSGGLTVGGRVAPYAQQLAGTGGTSAAGGLSPFGGLLMGGGLTAAALHQIKPHYNQMQRNMVNPQYDTPSQVSDYTQNMLPGQQIGTGQNTGLQPEYTQGFRYDQVQAPFNGYGQRQKGIVDGKEVSAYPNNDIGISNHISDAVGSVGNAITSPITGFANSIIGRYNTTRDLMEAVEPEGKSAASTGGGGQSVQNGATQSGYVQRIVDDRRETGKINKVTDEDKSIYGNEFGFDTKDSQKVKNLQNFLVNSNFDIGEFGADGVDGKYGNMTNEATATLYDDLSSSEGLKRLRENSPYLQRMYTEAFSGFSGDSQEELEEVFRDKIYAQIGRENSADGSLASGRQGRKGDKSQHKGVEVVQQRDDTSDKEVYEESSNRGNKTYKDKDGKIKKAGYQNQKYENRNNKGDKKDDKKD